MKQTLFFRWQLTQRPPDTFFQTNKIPFAQQLLPPDRTAHKALHIVAARRIGANRELQALVAEETDYICYFVGYAGEDVNGFL